MAKKWKLLYNMGVILGIYSLGSKSLGLRALGREFRVKG